MDIGWADAKFNSVTLYSDDACMTEVETYTQPAKLNSFYDTCVDLTKVKGFASVKNTSK